MDMDPVRTQKYVHKIQSIIGHPPPYIDEELRSAYDQLLSPVYNPMLVETADVSWHKKNKSTGASAKEKLYKYNRDTGSLELRPSKFTSTGETRKARYLALQHAMRNLGYLPGLPPLPPPPPPLPPPPPPPVQFRGIQKPLPQPQPSTTNVAKFFSKNKTMAAMMKRLPPPAAYVAAAAVPVAPAYVAPALGAPALGAPALGAEDVDVDDVVYVDGDGDADEGGKRKRYSIRRSNKKRSKTSKKRLYKHKQRRHTKRNVNRRRV